MWCVRFEVPRSCHARGSGNASERAPSDSDFILWSYLSITSTHAAQAAALISSIWIYVCVLSYVPRLQQLRNSTSYVSCRRNPCPIWKFLNTFGWWSSWEKDPMGKSCWQCTEREVSARLSSVGASLTKHFSIFLNSLPIWSICKSVPEHLRLSFPSSKETTCFCGVSSAVTWEQILLYSVALMKSFLTFSRIKLLQLGCRREIWSPQRGSYICSQCRWWTTLTCHRWWDYL